MGLGTAWCPHLSWDKAICHVVSTVVRFMKGVLFVLSPVDRHVIILLVHCFILYLIEDLDRWGSLGQHRTAFSGWNCPLVQLRGVIIHEARMPLSGVCFAVSNKYLLDWPEIIFVFDRVWRVGGRGISWCDGYRYWPWWTQSFQDAVSSQLCDSRSTALANVLASLLMHRCTAWRLGFEVLNNMFVRPCLDGVIKSEWTKLVTNGKLYN